MNVLHVDINRTASTAVRVAFGWEDRPMHTPLVELMARHDDWQARTTFTVVRNPYSRVLSMWKHRRHWSGDDFDTWVRRVFLSNDPIPKPDERYYGYLFWPQAWWITLGFGQRLPMVDHWFKLENFEDAKPHIWKLVGRTAPIPHINRADDRRPPVEVYDDLAQEIVRRYFRDDFEMFDYDPYSLPSTP